jgi:hypothetical protein
MASISKLTPGQILYDLRRQKMGNTTQSRTACFEVKVCEIAPDGLSITASWNGNPKVFYSARSVEKLRVNKPRPKREVFGLPSY